MRIEIIKRAIFAITHPHYWVMNNTYSKAWDTQLNKLMDEHKFIFVARCYASIGGVLVWTENYPYASFHPYILEVRPSRLTIHRAHNKYVEDVLDAEQEGK